MKEFLEKIRKVRELVRDANGTTKLVKKDKSLELTISAEPLIVVSSVDAVQRLCASMWSLEAGMTSFFERAEKRQDARRRDFLEEVFAHMDKGKG